MDSRDVEFDEIGDEERPKRGGWFDEPVWLALEAGKTIFVKLDSKQALNLVERFRGRTKRTGKSLHAVRTTRNGRPGVVMWLDSNPAAVRNTR